MAKRFGGRDTSLRIDARMRPGAKYVVSSVHDMGVLSPVNGTHDPPALHRRPAPGGPLMSPFIYQ